MRLKLLGRRFSALIHPHVRKWRLRYRLCPKYKDICKTFAFVFHLQSRTNVRMSNLAREQAKVWSSRHPLDVEVAERNLCDEFASTYPEDTATQALYTMMDTSGQVSPSLKAMASSWLRLNPDHAAAARDVYHGECAEQFASYFNDKTAETAFKVQLK
jgi:hypothetical protein